MTWATELDRVLRHSILARFQPAIRRVPWLHRLLLAGRERVLPFRSRYGLSRYQHRAIERFLAFSPARDRQLLEVGSDLDVATLRELADRGFWPVGINPDPEFVGRAVAAGAAGHRSLARADARQLPFPDASFSAVFTVAAFEHVHRLELALAELHRVLRPGGLLYSDFGPIWSCSVGHHVYAVVDGVEARHWKPGKNPVPHYAHLLLTPEELRPLLLRRRWVFPTLADAILEWIYRGDGVNRVFYEDYERIFRGSRFVVERLTPVRERVPRRLQRALEERCPGYADFGVRMVEVALRKPLT